MSVRGEPSDERTLSVLLRAHRRQLQLSQEDLALSAGLSVRTVSDIERGRVLRPHRDTLRKLTDALGLAGPEAAAVETVSAAVPRLPTGPWPCDPAQFPPRQLPRTVRRLSGRTAEMATLARILRERVESDRASDGAVLVLRGGPGVGRTACAVHLAHEVAAAFPDGQLYLALEDPAQGEADSLSLLGQVLRWLGVDGDQVPDRIESRSAVLRSVLANRRLLLVVDGVSAEEQLLPLLPGQGPSAVVATSRRPLHGLDDVVAHELEAFPPSAALEMIVDQLGTRRVAAEPTAARELASLCAGLPLAIRITCLHLSARPHWSIAKLTDMLRDGRRRLDVLTVGGLSVRSSFDRSYGLLDSEAALIFGLLAEAGAATVTAETAARIAGLPAPSAERGLDSLVDTGFARVVEPATPTSYQSDSLSRLYVRELAGSKARRRGRSAVPRLRPAESVRRDACLRG